VGARDGTDYHDVSPPAALPDPDTLPTTLAAARAEGWPEAYACGPVEFRRIGPRWPDSSRGDSRHLLAWLRPRAPIPDEPAVDAARVEIARSTPRLFARDGRLFATSTASARVASA